MQAVRKITLFMMAGIFLFQFDSVLSQEANDPGILLIATSQFPVSHDIDSNAVWIKKHMREAKQQNVDLIHFPECALSGYAGVDFKSLDSLNWQRLSTQTDSIMSLSNSSAAHSWPCHFITPDGLIAQKLEPNKAGILISEVNINKKYYDAGKSFRMDAINGKLNSGKTVEDERSKNRTGH